MRKTGAAIALFVMIAAAGAGCAGHEGNSLRERVFNFLAADGGVTRREGVPYGPLPRQKLDIYRTSANA